MIGYRFIPNNKLERNLYFYHPDHLGSSSYITDKDGKVIQHTEYMAFGEILFDEHSVSKMQPYLFNGKELDYETGLYYYGARYYDPKISIFLNVDPLVEKTMSPYAYVNNNPINLIAPTGMKGEDWYQDKYGQYVYDDTIKSQKDLNDKGIKGLYIGEHFQRGYTTYAADGYIYDDSTQGKGLPVENGRINNIEGVILRKKENNIGKIWNNNITRGVISDTYGIGFSSSISVFLGIGTTPINITLLTRGKEPGLGVVVDASVGVGYAPIELKRPFSDKGFINVGGQIGVGLQGSPSTAVNIQGNYQYTPVSLPIVKFK